MAAHVGKVRAMEAMKQLKRWLAPHSLDDTAKLDENDPRKPIVDAARVLQNDSGVDYPHYRRWVAGNSNT